jgi:hypothetical protein
VLFPRGAVLSVSVSHSPNTPASGFAELSVVRLVHPVKEGRRTLPAGAAGTVVHAYSDGIGYEVEFARPFHAIVTLEANNLTV